MEWYHYFSGFWAGMFLTNFLPHFIKGISGDAFPTPFAKPPGKGLSTPMVNTTWGLFNLVVGFLLFRADRAKRLMRAPLGVRQLRIKSVSP